jgi:hypothetical protein
MHQPHWHVTSQPAFVGVDPLKVTSSLSFAYDVSVVQETSFNGEMQQT